MKTVIASLLTLVILNSPLAHAPFRDIDNTRIESAIVTAMEYNGAVVVEDTTGNVWAFYDDGNGLWELGDGCELMIHNNGTPNIKADDIILAVHGCF